MSDHLLESLERLGETRPANSVGGAGDGTGTVRVVSRKRLAEWVRELVDKELAGRPPAAGPAGGGADQAMRQKLLESTQAELRNRLFREQEARTAREQTERELERSITEVQTLGPAADHLNAALLDLQNIVTSLPDSLAQPVARVHSAAGALIEAVRGLNDRMSTRRRTPTPN
ncbi:hypothetical protein LBMAG53_23000 [Planctomycetota bacterium]|nr:hypothetical protein LBMAG53_23000 [Planctomycetota bacterium]